MRVLTFSVAFLAALPVVAQPSDPAPAFEVVSIKPAVTTAPGLGIGLFTFPGGRVRASYIPVDYLIEQAFDIQPFQIAEAPRWLHDERFDLEGKPPASSPSSKSNPPNFKLPPNAEQRQMLQAALVDRFQLQYHWETKEGQVYLLVRTGKELNLQPAKDKNDYPWVGSFGGGGLSGDGIAGINATMALLAERVSPRLDRPVIDRTGIERAFDFKFRYPGDEPAPDIVSAILTSVQGLGLKLEASRGPVKILVIDRAERPSAN
jgi:uncharacterized protein (TIGR03435 family)